jgi:urease accessory protein
MRTTALGYLRLLQLADSALPIGTAAHSFGLETLAAEGDLAPEELPAFLRDYLLEAGSLDAAHCRAGYRLAEQGAGGGSDFAREWADLCFEAGALKPGRESRAASAILGRRLLELVARVAGAPQAVRALEVTRATGAEAHFSAAFGLAGGVLALDEELTVLAYLQQLLSGLVSAYQRLMPLGQSRASALLWEMGPSLVEAADRSRVEGGAVPCFTPAVDAASMRHPGLRTRLFVS